MILLTFNTYKENFKAEINHQHNRVCTVFFTSLKIKTSNKKQMKYFARNRHVAVVQLLLECPMIIKIEN
jgi:hypothetical protein